MFQRRRVDPTQIPPQAPGECRHLYLTGDATCVHCGMKFELAWSAPRNSITFPTIRNTGIALLCTALLAASQAFGLTILGYAFLVGTVLFFTRVLLGGLELFGKHGFVPGKLGPLVKRPVFNILLPKRYLTTVGFVRFPVDKDTHAQFNIGDTLLVEHLRWSRLPVAIYKGRMPRS